MHDGAWHEAGQGGLEEPQQCEISKNFGADYMPPVPRQAGMAPRHAEIIQTNSIKLNHMNTEKLNLSGGYTAEIAQDDCTENPWENWDCQPPIMVFNLDRHHGRIEDYKTGLTMRDIFDLVPLSAFENGAALDALGLPASEIEMPWDVSADGLNPEGWRDAIRDCLPDSPTSWGEAIEYLDKCETLCGLAGIECLNEQSNGYSQGDCARVFLAAMPDWIKETGNSVECIPGSLVSDLRVWSAWAWGDVYGIASITRPDGSEVEDVSTWGFYGDDHKQSGLLESAEDSVAWDTGNLAKEAAAQAAWDAREAMEQERAACADIITI